MNLKNNPVVKNIIWLVMDKFLMLFLQFFVGIKVANYYGSETYGVYAYAGAVVAFFPIVLEIINPRVIKEYYGEDFNHVVSCVTTIRNICSFVLLLGVIVYGMVFNISRELYYLLVLLSLDSFLICWTFGIENYFEFKLLSKKTVVANNIVKVLAYILQYIGIMLQFTIVIIPIIRVIGSLIRGIILKRAYFKEYGERIKFILDKSLTFKMIGESYYLWISFVAFIIYTQIDKIMIGNMLGDREVGIYTIGLQLSSILAILIGPFQNSIYPKLMEAYKRDYNEYKKIYLKSNTLFTQIYILGGILSIFVVKWLFPYLYSSEYRGAILTYSILTISIFFKANGALQTGHMTLKKITKKSFYKTLVGLILNVSLNLYLIPKFKIDGAALATAITQFVTLFLMDYFIPEYREQFFIQVKSLNPLNLIKLKD